MKKLMIMSLMCFNLLGVKIEQPIILKNVEKKNAIARGGEGITPSTFLGKEVVSPEYKVGADSHVHRKRVKIEQDAVYTFVENQPLAKLSSWVSPNNIDVTVTNSYSLLDSFSVTTTSSTSYQSEWALQVVAGISEDSIKASSKQQYDLSIRKTESKTTSYSCSVEFKSAFSYRFSDAAIEYARKNRYEICISVVADYYVVKSKIWTQRWLVWGWQHLKDSDEEVEACFISHYYITAIFYNPNTKEVILHECN